MSPVRQRLCATRTCTPSRVACSTAFFRPVASSVDNVAKWCMTSGDGCAGLPGPSEFPQRSAASVSSLSCMQKCLQCDRMHINAQFSANLPATYPGFDVGVCIHIMCMHTCSHQPSLCLSCSWVSARRSFLGREPILA